MVFRILSSSPSRLAGLLTVAALLSAAEPALAARRQTASGTTSALDAVLEARAVLAEPNVPEVRLAVAVKTLLDANDHASLRAVLNEGTESAAAGVLKSLAMAVQTPALYEPLLPDLITAASSAAASLRQPGALALERLAAASNSATAALIAELQLINAPERGRAIVEALGGCTQLVAVKPLIEQLEGAVAASARSALRRLTGHDLGEDAHRAAWQLFWEKHAHLSREALLDLGIEAERRRLAQNLEQLQSTLDQTLQEVIKARIDAMGTDNIGRLIAALGDSYPAVRKEAALRLSALAAKEQALSAIPHLLGRLGHPAAASNGESNGTASPGPVTAPNGNGSASNGTTAGLPVETDNSVRAALVRTLGVLGRNRPEVQQALLEELRATDEAVAEAAASSLVLLRGQPALVGPLLQYLERLARTVPNPGVAEADRAAELLLAIAANRPAGLVSRLQPWMRAGLSRDGGQPARVRAAALRAIIASEGDESDLERIAASGAADEAKEVRFAVAFALGERLVRLRGAESTEPARIVALLAALLNDVDASVRAEAVTALGKSAAAEALGLLEERARVETEASVVDRVLEAIGALGRVEGGAAIGRIVARGPASTTLQTASRAALGVLGAQYAPADWDGLGETLSSVGAHDLSAWVFGRLAEMPLEAPEERDLGPRARARRAEELLHAGRAADARTALLELHAAEAALPPLSTRLALLASACESLGLHGEAADHHLARLKLLPEGEAARVPTLRAASAALRRSGRDAEALPLLRGLVAEFPADNALLLDLAGAEEGLGQLDQALATLERLESRVPAEQGELLAQVQAALVRVRTARAGAVPAVPPAVSPAPGS
ncbi:MAG: hypothetical protein ACT4PU_00415 [Planctomycetota bacterium]